MNIKNQEVSTPSKNVEGKLGRKGLRVALGTVSALASGMIVHPIDTMKIRMQCQGELQTKPNEHRNLFRNFGHVLR